MSERAVDVVVVGAGIVGAACAFELAREGLSVLVLDGREPGGGATAEGMGHVLVMDASPAQLALTRYSRALWDALAAELPAAAEWQVPGTIWVAANAAEQALAERKVADLRVACIEAELLDARSLQEAEPNLCEDLPGGLLVPGDSVVYPPVVTEWLLHEVCEHGGRLRCGVKVVRIDAGSVTMQDGAHIEAGLVVDAAGTRALAILSCAVAGVSIRPRKGHLAITQREPGFCRHQLIELGYQARAHGHQASSVACNVQPRKTGQVLIGSSRQYDRTDRAVEPAILFEMLERATFFMPGLAKLSVIRAWTGFRAATEDSLPLIGPVPGLPGVLLAAGHEGLGITTSLGTARLIADLVMERESEIPRAPYRVDRAAKEDADA